MATSNFVLSPAEEINWQGSTNAQVTIQVVPIGTTKIRLDQPAYPDDTPLASAGDKATLKVESGRHDLNVNITPRNEPPVVWSVVEIGKDGTSQTLITVNDPLRSKNPFGTAITIIGA